jgi:cardiolipin synthase
MASIKSKKATDYFDHNKTRLIHGGRSYFDLLQEMISQATHTIHLQTYIFDADETGKQIVEALLDAAKRKVDVFLLLDGYASQGFPNELKEIIRKAGIRFRFFEPLLRSKHFYFGRRLHHKVVVVDNYKSLVGGMNISNRYNDMSDQPAWLDWALYSEGEIASVLEDVCRRRMKYYHYKPKQEIKIPAALSQAHCPMRVRINDWVDGKKQISRSFLAMLVEAQSQVIIMSPYFLPGNEFKKRMSAALRRGVKVKVILAGISDIKVAKWAERYVYQWLLRNNIEVHEYSKSVLHGKISVRDGEWLTAGSYNVNNLSAYASVELNLDVNDRELATEAEDELEKIIQNDCVRITEESFKRSNTILKKFAQWASYEMLRFLLFLTTFYFRSKE